MLKVADPMVGFCSVELNPAGPDHEYVAPTTKGAVKLIVLPWHTGLLLETVGAIGAGFTTSVVLPAAELHPEREIVTLYVPAFAAVIVETVGFCNELVNPFGPVQE